MKTALLSIIAILLLASCGKVNDRTAYAVAQGVITKQLKTPSTAQYPEEYKCSADGQTYDIHAYVDAQNLFGAMLRTPWHVNITYLGGDPDDWESWKLNSYEIGEEKKDPLESFKMNSKEEAEAYINGQPGSTTAH
jgi:hypothetical protein